MPGTTIESAPVNDDFADIAAALTDSLAADGQTSMTGSVKGYPGSASAPSYTWASSPTDGFFLSGSHQIGLAINGTFVGFFNANGFNTTAGQPTQTPIGSVQDFAGSTAPPGWYLCFGQNVSRTTYALLFAIIGTTYGAGDGLTTFGLPDCRGRMTAGQDNMGGTPANRITAAGGNFDGTVLGNSGGSQNQTLTTTQLPATTPGLTFSGTPVTPSFTGTTHTLSTVQTTLASWGGGQAAAGAGSGAVLASAVSTSAATVVDTPAGSIGAITPAGTISGSFGSGSAFADLSPTIIFSKIIFAGA